MQGNVSETWHGFLQGAGIRYGRDTGRKAKVLTIEVFDHATSTWQPLVDDATYFLITSNFVANGGDGFDMLKGIQEFGPSNQMSMMQGAAIFQEYLAANTPVCNIICGTMYEGIDDLTQIAPKLEGRVVDCNTTANAANELCRAAQLSSSGGRRAMLVIRSLED